MSTADKFKLSNSWRSAKRLLFILGDQLDRQHPGLERIDKDSDVVLLAEVREEAEHVPSHRQRTVLFLSAMRHHALWLSEQGYRVRYIQLDARDNSQSLAGELERAAEVLEPAQILCMRAGEQRVGRALEKCCEQLKIDLKQLENPAFTCSLSEFDEWADGRKALTMEYFYRERRRKLNILVDDKGKPEGGSWNFDKDNRKAFKTAPDNPTPYQARPDAITKEVMRLVETTWPDAYGSMPRFIWPVTREEALRGLDDFIGQRLQNFGPYEDAMWTGEAFLYHSLLSSSLNLGLLRPLECVEAALCAYEDGAAPLNSVEGFIRQIIGWREFIRGVYYREGPGYVQRNELDQQGQLPGWFWTGETDMACLSYCLSEVRENAYGHHIPRLMVIGNFALIAGINPQSVQDWFLAMYVDAVEWVTAPNVIGMSQHADGGVVGSKPYAASGKYINRMSNYCKDCKYDVSERSGDGACPFNVFYWDFLNRHRKTFAANRRMTMILKNLERMDKDETKAISTQATELRKQFGLSTA